jgi:hypothetical protein
VRIPCCSCAAPSPDYSFVQEAFNGGFSTYHALQVKLERRYSAGLYLLNSFTWSKSIDNVAGHLEAFNGDGSRINIRNPSLEKAVSSYDVPFNNTTTLTYELPFGRGRKHLKSLPALVDAVAGGWRTSLINTMTAGRPITITYSPSAAGQVSTVVTYRPT